ncbi:hypothetical protein FDA09_14535 [Clostridium botulinum]|uniref:hypothetical protein n=1 Tax=Clostridium botulinum TaxID=1491 RepID=UPI000772D818|nr:hypothetical protein [Clostridium botulinum]NFF80446.1 hypothetical protein [Clostridium botulinum]NFH81280.1 hypothetical protein [Clostridium botulinum]NFH84552.1 hypothetical protein [Clostridium botulinum]NFI12588.1 hypothetical protein [Clostridium botulinum]NFI15471.1 hypothetical protein [Clostridium botulinum]
METISIALICTILGVVMSYATFQRNKDNSIRAETKEGAIMATKLDFISQGVNNIQVKMEAQENKFITMNERITRVEESTKSAHHRIDTIKGADD